MLTDGGSQATSDTVTSPVGATITSCTTPTGLLVCRGGSHNSYTIQCSIFKSSCPAGSRVRLTIQSTAAGALTESILFTPFSGTTPTPKPTPTALAPGALVPGGERRT